MKWNLSSWALALWRTIPSTNVCPWRHQWAHLCRGYGKIKWWQCHIRKGCQIFYHLSGKFLQYYNELMLNSTCIKRIMACNTWHTSTQSSLHHVAINTSRSCLFAFQFSVSGYPMPSHSCLQWRVTSKWRIMETLMLAYWVMMWVQAMINMLGWIIVLHCYTLGMVISH